LLKKWPFLGKFENCNLYFAEKVFLCSFSLRKCVFFAYKKSTEI